MWLIHARSSSAESDLTTLQDAEKVAKNLMSLQERMFRLFQQVDELSGHAHKQLGSLSRAEVSLQMTEKDLLTQQPIISALPSDADRWTST